VFHSLSVLTFFYDRFCSFVRRSYASPAILAAPLGSRRSPTRRGVENSVEHAIVPDASRRVARLFLSWVSPVDHRVDHYCCYCCSSRSSLEHAKFRSAIVDVMGQARVAPTFFGNSDEYTATAFRNATTVVDGSIRARGYALPFNARNLTA